MKVRFPKSIIFSIYSSFMQPALAIPLLSIAINLGLKLKGVSEPNSKGQ